MNTPDPNISKKRALNVSSSGPETPESENKNDTSVMKSRLRIIRPNKKRQKQTIKNPLKNHNRAHRAPTQKILV